MSHKKLSYILISGVVGCVILYAIVILYFSWPISSFTVTSSGVFGDSFGLLTALFSGLAFAGLIITIVMQKEDLSLQREELSLTRNELKAQKEEFAIQNETLKCQRFENTFFHLLSLHNQNVESLNYKPSNKHEVSKRRECFPDLLGTLRLDVIGTHDLGDGDGPKEITVIDNYNTNYRKISSIIEHYQKTLYQILLFVDSDVAITNKKKYTNFIRAQLSQPEIELLFFHCLGEFGVEKFKGLVEKYEMFEHLKLTDRSSKCLNFYNRRAFGKNVLLIKEYDKA
ncbi:hypothetical protein JWG39_03600 [Desulforhopalus vacuolatus]|uniref:putative phage abortive infection protein n=1 Tax=Desulforhopalus vacuolatus TaxID=40414 RepID=UPI001962E6B4|nr:putative phage abortive infection protein [Desulforhopalus vacuolatus]MBM9518899.1 hypothetical protein [Desulforhopalus vacuolatus]